MPETGYIAVFLIGLLGGTHCVGMCGGIVSALTVQLCPASRREWPLHLAYNLGRISSYTLAGAAMGAIGTVGMLLQRHPAGAAGALRGGQPDAGGAGLYSHRRAAGLSFVERSDRACGRASSR
jgi:sulfite exporter TauE/SafE